MSGAVAALPCIAALVSIVALTGVLMATSRLFPVVTPGNAEEMRKHALKLFVKDLDTTEEQARGLAVLAVKYCMYYKKPLTFGYQLVYSVISHYRGDWLEDGKLGKNAVEAYREKHRNADAADVPYLFAGNFDVASGSFPEHKRRRKAKPDSLEAS